jgi:hypothetical protein
VTGAAPSELHALGEILDRAVHRTVRRFGAVAPVMILADASGSLLSFVVRNGVLWWAIAMLIENRARVVALVSVRAERGHRIAWSAALRYPVALLFAVPALLDYIVPYVAVFVFGAPFFVAQVFPRIVTSGAPRAAFVFLALTLLTLAGAAVLVALLLFMLGALVAMIDVLFEGAPPLRALRFWLAQTFRRRGFVSTLLAAAVFALLVVGTPFLLSWVPFPIPIPIPRVATAALHGIPEGIADAIALLFAWEWRDALLARRHGRDIEALLAAQSASSASPSASSPGVTTSQ